MDAGLRFFGFRALNRGFSRTPKHSTAHDGLGNIGWLRPALSC